MLGAACGVAPQVVYALADAASSYPRQRVDSIERNVRNRQNTVNSTKYATSCVSMIPLAKFSWCLANDSCVRTLLRSDPAKSAAWPMSQKNRKPAQAMAQATI